MRLRWEGGLGISVGAGEDKGVRLDTVESAVVESVVLLSDGRIVALRGNCTCGTGGGGVGGGVSDAGMSVSGRGVAGVSVSGWLLSDVAVVVEAFEVVVLDGGSGCGCTRSG